MRLPLPHRVAGSLALVLLIGNGCDDGATTDAAGGDSAVSGGGTGAAGSGGGGTTEQTGEPAALGDPSTTLFNGLLTVLDPFAEVPAIAVAPFVGELPLDFVEEALPYIPDVKVVAHHDSVVFHVANVAGAADYRAYVLGPDVELVSTALGAQPRGAVIACAGFRQHTYRSAVVDGHHTRELLQTVELPGLLPNVAHTVIVEATASPCPFVGMPAHIDAQITMENDGTTNSFHAADPNTYKYTGIPIAVFSAFDSVRASYGNEILNGQGAAIDYPDRETAATIGAAVPPGDATFPNDPEVIARSVFSIEIPLADQPAAASTFDVGPHSLTDDFVSDLAVSPSSIAENPDYDDYNGFSINPLFQMDTWEFWGRFMQSADSGDADLWSASSLSATQAFTRHGRLYTTFGDSGQDVGGSLAFASLVAPVVQLGSERYVHSVFRINSEATHRRYWYWALCGAASSDQIFDSTNKQYKLRPLVYETTFGPGGNNPSVPDGHTLSSDDTSDDAPGIARECLTITEEGRPEDPFAEGGGAQSSAVIRAQIHPANKSHGIIALGNEASDEPVLNGQSSLGFRFRLGAGGERIAPMIDPYDQLSPLVRYDIFVRSDRLVVYINGEQGFCVDMSETPLSMEAAMIGYGDLIYHSSVEYQELSSSAANEDAQLYQYLLNTPIATSRVWDRIGHSDDIDIPPELGTFDPVSCRKPSDSSVQ